jgi:predicted Ser/Thr protein kinase
VTTGDDKTVVRPSDRVPQQLDETQPTVAGNGSPTMPTPSGMIPNAPLTPPTIPDVQLEGELGRGGMGVVYRGRQPYLDRKVAVKLLLLARDRDGAEYLKRFQREAKILAGLSHPHIVGCYQAGATPDGNPYLVMEFIDGPNLREWVTSKGPLAPRQALALVRDCARALEHALGSGIIHRDVKPENVLLAKRDGDPPWTAKLVDLGLARPTAKGAGGSEMHLTMQGVLMGTPATMAPEQFDDPDHVDHRADIYGLGCVLYHALTGMPAFASKTLGELVSAKVSGPIPDPNSTRRDLPRGIAELVQWLLARDRAQRPQTYHDLIERCDALLRDPEGTRSSPMPMMLGAGAVLVAAIATAAYFALHTSGAAVVQPTRETPTQSPLKPIAAPAGTPAAVPEFGEAQPLIPRNPTQFPTVWAPEGESSLWAPNEEAEDEVVGTHGAIAHALEGKPTRIAGTLHHGASDRVAIAFAFANGDAISLTVKRLNTISAGLEGGERAKPLGSLLTSPIDLHAREDLPFELTATGTTVQGTIAGYPLGPLASPGLPTAVVLYVEQQEGPAQVGHLTLSYPK